MGPAALAGISAAPLLSWDGSVRAVERHDHVLPASGAPAHDISGT
jgi:hypothetical protein